jgi:broad specificity phosphatase PhoE
LSRLETRHGDPFRKTEPMPEHIYLIRHGQSTFNAIFELSGVDPLHFDARLSEIGIEQVAAARQAVSEIPVDLVVVSPLTRAVQTAMGLFGEATAPIVVTDLHRELLENSCDVGRSPSALSTEFPILTFDHLNDPWWHVGQKDNRGVAVEPDHLFAQRVTDFSRWLRARPEDVVVVVGHGGFFRRLTGRNLRNCEIMEWSPEE